MTVKQTYDELRACGGVASFSEATLSANSTVIVVVNRFLSGSSTGQSRKRVAVPSFVELGASQHARRLAGFALRQLQNCLEPQQQAVNAIFTN